MTIAVGEKLPETQFACSGEEGRSKKTTSELFGGKKVVLFGVPGAFTATCSVQLPGYVKNHDSLLAAGVDCVAVIAVNDIFVMQAWQESNGAGMILHLADWDASFVKALGLDIDLGKSTLGVRSKRFAMIVDDGVVTALDIEQSPGDLDVSSAESVLSRLNRKAEGSAAA